LISTELIAIQQGIYAARTDLIRTRLS
jgi:hypothetical protein